MFQVECPAQGDPSASDDQTKPEYPAGIGLLSIGFEKLLKLRSTFVPGSSDPTLLGLTTSVPGSGVAVGGRGVPVAVGIWVDVLVGVGVLVPVTDGDGIRVGVAVGVGDDPDAAFSV